MEEKTIDFGILDNFLKEYPSFEGYKNMISGEVITASSTSIRTIIHTTSIDRQKVKKVIRKELFGYDNKKMENIFKK